MERGNWAEGIRQMADVWLPWLPHRTNRELARWFDVRVVAGNKKDKTHPELVCLRLVPPGTSQRDGTYIEATFSKKDGLPRTWESYLQGKLTGRIRFSDPADKKDLPGWQTPIGDIRQFDQLPPQARQYVTRLEELISCPASIISVGMRREQTIHKIPIL